MPGGERAIKRHEQVRQGQRRKQDTAELGQRRGEFDAKLSVFIDNLYKTLHARALTVLLIKY